MGRRRLVERTEAGHRVEQLIVESGHKESRDPALKRVQLQPQSRAFRSQFKTLRNRLLNRRDVPDQFLTPRLDLRESRLAVLRVVPTRLLAHQLAEFLLEGASGRRNDLDGRPVQLTLCSGRRQPRSGRHERSAAPGDPERGREFGHRSLVDPALGVTDLGKGEQRDQTGGERQGRRTANANVELGRDSEAALGQFAEPVDHGFAGASRRVADR